jgi:hypothetical protein
MSESNEEIRAKVEAKFDLELEAVRSLNELSEELVEIWPTVRGARREADRILSMAIARGVTTFSAALELAEAGFGRETQMLNRSLFEGLLVSHWISANPDQAEKRFPASQDFELHLMRERVAEFAPEELEVEDGIELDPERLAEAQRLFGKANQRMWTGHRSLWDLFKEVEDRWERPWGEALTRYMQNEYQRNTKEMHATTSALFGLVLDPFAERGGIRGLSVRIGPGPDEVAAALFNSFFNHSNLLLLLVDHFELGTEAEIKVKGLVVEHQFAFVLIDPALAKKTGRNDPCPCGSPKKFKDCHWDRIRRGPNPARR